MTKKDNMIEKKGGYKFQQDQKKKISIKGGYRLSVHADIVDWNPRARREPSLS